MRVSILQRAGCGRSQTVWGHNAGDVASRAVVDALTAISPSSRPSAFIAQIDDCLSRVNRQLYDRSVADNSAAPCGTTAAVLAVFGAHVACLWAGDSRIYRLRGTTLEQITRDHSEVREAADDGRSFATGSEPTPNVITRAVGGTVDL